MAPTTPPPGSTRLTLDATRGPEHLRAAVGHLVRHAHHTAEKAAALAQGGLLPPEPEAAPEGPLEAP